VVKRLSGGKMSAKRLCSSAGGIPIYWHLSGRSRTKKLQILQREGPGARMPPLEFSLQAVPFSD
jgi:hypothetical protein